MLPYFKEFDGGQNEATFDVAIECDDALMVFLSASLTSRRIGEEKAMKYGPFALLIVSSTVCVIPPASARPEESFDIVMLNPVVVNTISVASDMSVVENDFLPMAYRPPPVVHGPAYYPVWRDGVSRGSGWFEYLRSGRFFLHERDDDK
ncbi:hypothetical protein IQ287_05665 [Burkholderia sp. R-69927]|uniref:hypothetical protein n=1 Tax=Paraburkholderia domus TaxID=2793075 RepID=UPI00191356DB|nr:hypothetical protein [Paraburkholderia domus]MBK5085483.1 hypothetical protein [Burkholderia sp. R-69927]